MARVTSLKTYKEKRDFKRTPEPRGKKAARKKTKKPIFVIQKHDARRLHYDLRLEVDGVLVSWAVPKGPSTDPADKRLAVRTEDHPLDYKVFEGVIPDGEYGAGPMIVWDRGTYRNIMADKAKPLAMGESIDKGHVEIWLEGNKLRGGWALVRMANRKGERRENWLLIKMNDEEADELRDVVRAEPQSVVSGRTIEEVEAAEAHR